MDEESFQKESLIPPMLNPITIEIQKFILKEKK